MGIFDFLKKKKKSNNNIDISYLVKNNLVKVPEVKFNKIAMNGDQLNDYIKDTSKNSALLKTLPKKDFPEIWGKIVGYHPYPKDFITSMYAIVNHPVIGEVQKSFVVNCSGIAELESNHLLLPVEGTWISFKDLGENKNTNGEIRFYGLATLVIDQKIFDMILKVSKIKK